MLCHKRHCHPVINQLPVRLVGDHVNRMANAGLGGFQDALETVQCLGRINSTGRIVGIINDHSFRLFINVIIQHIQVQLEILCVRRNHHGLSAEIGNIAAVLPKKRSKTDHFVLII